MPFKSRAQAAFLRINKPDVYKKLLAETPKRKLKSLPHYVKGSQAIKDFVAGKKVSKAAHKARSRYLSIFEKARKRHK
jgi:hypothetical protein